MIENNLENGIGGNPEEQLDEEALESMSQEVLDATDGVLDNEIAETSQVDEVRGQIYDNEKFLDDPNYLLMLNEAVFQSIADNELYEGGKIKKKNVAVIDIDIPNSTAGLEAALEKFEREHTNRTPDIKAVEDYIPLLMTVHDAIVDVFRQYGIKGDKFLGDGARGLCEGGVHQAMAAAKLLKQNLSQYGLDVRIGIDVGDATIVGCGDKRIKKAFLTGDVVESAEVIQKHTQVGGIALSPRAEEIKQEQAEVDPYKWMEYREVSTALGEIRPEIEAREAFLPASRVRELRYQYLSEKEPSPSISEVCTLVIDLPDIGEREFGDANKIVTEIFEIVAKSGGEVDKMDGKRIMANFVAGRSDFDGVQAGVRITQALNELNIPFRVAAARSNALSVVMGGDRTVIGRVANLAHREVTDSPMGVFTVDEDLMKRVKTQVKESESIGASEYKGVGERERFIIYELKGWYELARAEKLLFRQNEIDVLNKEYDLVEQTGGRCIAVAGRQGFGKSALVAEFLAMKKREEHSTYFGRAEEYTSQQQFAVWRDLFSNVFGLEEMSTQERTEMLLNKFPHLQESLALLDPILGTKFKRTALIKSLETRPEDMKEIQAEMIAELLSALSQDGSTAVVLLEDMQFFDEDSQSLLMGVLHRIKDTNSFLVVTTRPHDPEGTLNLPPEEFEKLDNVGKMELGSALPAFDDKQWEKVKEDWWTAANLCVALDKADFEQDENFFRRMFEKIYEETEGNFRAFQTYLRSWTVYGVQKGYFEAREKIVDGKLQIVYSLIRDENENPVRISDEDFKKLGDVSGVETRRFHNLELPKVKDGLLSASVIGPDFSVEELLHINDGLGEEEIVGLLGEAERREFIRHISSDRYAFANNEISTAIYKTRSEELDPTLQYQHRLLGQYYRGKNPDDSQRIAFHLRHSDDHLATLEVLDEMVRAKELVGWGVTLTMIEYASRTLDKIKKNTWSVIPAWTNEQLQYKEPLADIIKDKMIHREIERLLLAAKLQRRLKVVDAVELVSKAQKEFREFHSDDDKKWLRGDLVTWCSLLASQARNYDLLGQTDEAEKVFEQIFDITNIQFNLSVGKKEDFESERNVMFETHYFYGLHLSSLGKHEFAIDELEKALEYGKTPTDEAMARNGLGIFYMRKGDHEGAEREFRRLIELSETNKIIKEGLGTYWMNLGEVNIHQGNLEAASDCYNKALESAERVKDARGKLNTKANLALLKRTQEKYDEALQIMDEVIMDANRRKVTRLVSMFKSESVYCLFELERWEEADSIIKSLKTDSGSVFQGRGYTQDAIRDLLKGKRDINDINKLFVQGIEHLEGVHNESSAAFDRYFFGAKLVSLDYMDIGKKYLQEAKNYYEKYKTPVLIPKIDELLSK